VNHKHAKEFKVLELRTIDGQTAPYCILFRPESPYGHGALDLAIETASIQGQDWVAPE